MERANAYDAQLLLFIGVSIIDLSASGDDKQVPSWKTDSKVIHNNFEQRLAQLHKTSRLEPESLRNIDAGGCALLWLDTLLPYIPHTQTLVNF